MAVLQNLAENGDANTVAAQFTAQDIGGGLETFPDDVGGVYQSVMMTPPNGSAEASGMKLSVSSAPRQR